MSMIERTEKLLETVFGCDLKGLVVTVIAPAGLGKTTFVGMQLPTYLFQKAKENEELNEAEQFTIVNTDASFLDQRFLEVLREFGVEYKEIRKHFKVHYVYSLYEQENIIRTLVKNGLEKVQEKPLYCVVDPFNHILRMEFAKADENYRLNVVGRLSPKLEYQLHLLSMLARKAKTTVVITMLPKKQWTDKVPVKWQNAYFGPTEIAHLSDIVIWLSHGVHDARGVTVHVLKHRLRETPYSVNVKLTKGGLVLHE